MSFIYKIEQKFIFTTQKRAKGKIHFTPYSGFTPGTPSFTQFFLPMLHCHKKQNVCPFTKITDLIYFMPSVNECSILLVPK